MIFYRSTLISIMYPACMITIHDRKSRALHESLLFQIQWPRNEIIVLDEIPPTQAPSTIGSFHLVDLLPTPHQITRPSVDPHINSTQEGHSSSSERPLRSNVLT